MLGMLMTTAKALSGDTFFIENIIVKTGLIITKVLSLFNTELLKI